MASHCALVLEPSMAGAVGRAHWVLALQSVDHGPRGASPLDEQQSAGQRCARPLGLSQATGV